MMNQRDKHDQRNPDQYENRQTELVILGLGLLGGFFAHTAAESLWHHQIGAAVASGIATFVLVLIAVMLHAFLIESNALDVDDTVTTLRRQLAAEREEQELETARKAGLV